MVRDLPSPREGTSSEGISPCLGPLAAKKWKNEISPKAYPEELEAIRASYANKSTAPPLTTSIQGASKFDRHQESTLQREYFSTVASGRGVFTGPSLEERVERSQKVPRLKHIKSSFVMVPVEFEATFQRRPADVVDRGGEFSLQTESTNLLRLAMH